MGKRVPFNVANFTSNEHCKQLFTVCNSMENRRRAQFHSEMAMESVLCVHVTVGNKRNSFRGLHSHLYLHQLELIV